MSTPGIKVVPLHIMGESDINHVFYEDVRIPVSMRLGDENDGWRMITSQLNYERVVLCSSGIVERALADVNEWAQSTTLADGRRVADQEWVQLLLARVHATPRVPAPPQLEDRVGGDNGDMKPADASATKVFGSELYLEAFRVAHGDPRAVRYLNERHARSRAARRPRALLPRARDRDVRGRHGRGAARPDRDVRPRDAARATAPPTHTTPRTRGKPTMDLSLTEEQADLQGLTRQILEREVTLDRLKEVEAGGDDTDRDLWQTLATAGVVGDRPPRGARRRRATGSSRRASCSSRSGLTVAPVPYYATIVLGALPIVRFGTAASTARALAGVAAGDDVPLGRARRARRRSVDADHDRDRRRRRLAARRRQGLHRRPGCSRHGCWCPRPRPAAT